MGKHFGEKIIGKVLAMKREGKSNREIGEYYELSKKQLENLLTRHRIKEENRSKGILSNPKGRPRTRGLVNSKN